MYHLDMSSEIEKTVSFTVPYLTPPSVNHYTRSCYYKGNDGMAHKGKKLTPEAQAYRDAVALFARGRTISPETPAGRKKARYSVRMDVYLGPGQRGDFDNFWKSGLDALVRCHLIHTDAAVDGEHSRCVVHKDDRENPRTEYAVTRLETK
jgi:Holliday junction resolvase RusA-like endonuclease